MTGSRKKLLRTPGACKYIVAEYDKKNSNSCWKESYLLKLVYELNHPKNQVTNITELKLSTNRHNNLTTTGVVKNKECIITNTIDIVTILLT